jgi:hypothetical protein
LKRKTTLKLELRWKRNYEGKEINEEGRRRKCGDIFVTSRECACSRTDHATWVATARFTLGVKAEIEKIFSICPNY